MTEIPKIVAQRLATATSAAHPDPDVITAFLEKSLGEGERDQLLGHLSQCRDCREVVALSLPQLETTLPVESAHRAWLAWPVLRWGALAACVVVVGAAVTLHRQYRSSPLPDSKDERPTKLKVAEDTLQTRVRSDANALLAAKSVPQAPEAKADLASAGKKAESTDKESLKGLVASSKTAKPPAPAPGPRDLSSIPVPAQAAEADSAAAGVSPSYNALGEAVPGRAKDALQPSSTDAPAAVSGAMLAKSATVVVQSELVANKRALASPGLLAPRWTLSADGTLQRSLDSGGTWQTISVAGQAVFHALAADGLEIWVGGAKGALYHSSDAGQNWTQVQPAANGEVLTGDIIGVEFTDRLHGTVTASGPQKWITTDAGQSWQKQ